MDTASWIAVIVVCCFFLAIMYKALKEPLDALFGLFARMFGWGAGKVSSGASAVTTGSVIEYG